MWLRNRNKSAANHAKIKSRQHINTLIGSNTIIAGDISFTGGLHIDGQVSGQINSAKEQHSLLIVGSSAKIMGDIKVERAVINGQIYGNLYVYDHLEIGEKAIIVGDVHYNLLEMGLGSEIRGSLIPNLKKEPMNLLEDHSQHHIKIEEVV
jgi:cytoskeletal protein CcmA (bactofilin family)